MQIKIFSSFWGLPPGWVARTVLYIKKAVLICFQVLEVALIKDIQREDGN